MAGNDCTLTDCTPYQTGCGYLEKGLGIIPVMVDGTKRPKSSWKRYMSEIIDQNEWERHSNSGCGIGVVCGAISGGLVVFDFETEKAWHDFLNKLEENALQHRIHKAPVAKTPGGYHLYLLTPDSVKGPNVLARDNSDPHAKSGGLIIEVRAEGAYVIAPGSPSGTHSKGEYHWLSQGWIADGVKPTPLAEGELAGLVAVARSLDRSGITSQQHYEYQDPLGIPSGPEDLFFARPGDLFNELATWRFVLEPCGATLGEARGDGCIPVRRPCKTDPGESGNIHPQMGLHVFSTAWPGLESGKNYNKFAAWTSLYHNGDYGQAARVAAMMFGLNHPANQPGEEVAVTGNDGLRLLTRKLSTYRIEQPRYLVCGPDGGGILPVGLSLLVGVGGVGKSTLVRALLTSYTTGIGPFLVESPGKALMVMWEDDPASVILPSLVCSGGDPEQIEFLEGVTNGGVEETWRPKNIDLLGKYLEENPDCKLVIVDVLSSLTAAGGADSCGAEDTRRLLDPLHRLGQLHEAAILVVHHLNKKNEGTAAARVAGSVQITGTARLVWILARHPEFDDRRVLAVAKSNLPGTAKGLSFVEEPVPFDEAVALAESRGIEMAPDLPEWVFQRIRLVDSPALSAEELVQQNNRSSPVGPSKPELCADFILEHLIANGPTLSSTLEQLAADRGWQGGTWKSARGIAKGRGVVSFKQDRQWWLRCREESNQEELLDNQLAQNESNLPEPEFVPE